MSWSHSQRMWSCSRCKHLGRHETPTRGPVRLSPLSLFLSLALSGRTAPSFFSCMRQVQYYGKSMFQGARKMSIRLGLTFSRVNQLCDVQCEWDLWITIYSVDINNACRKQPASSNLYGRNPGSLSDQVPLHETKPLTDVQQDKCMKTCFHFLFFRSKTLSYP